MTVTPPADLRSRVEHYLRAHHTMTLATAGPPPLVAAGPGDPLAPLAATAEAGPSLATAGGSAGSPGSAVADGAVPHAASVFYAVDDTLRLIFLSMPTSTHGLHIGTTAGARVAVTVTEQYEEWESIQGVQLWGTAERLRGSAKVAAMAVYLRRFPFVRDLMERPSLAETVRTIAVYRVKPERVAFTDNTTGVFGREVLDLRSR